MKKVVGYGILLLFIFSSIIVGYMINNDQKYIENMKEKINLEEISYINKYDNKYLVLDKVNLYLFDDKYQKIIEISKDKLCDNNKKYEIIYRNDEFQYLEDVYQKEKLIYKYYDIYTCKLIEEIVLGGL